MNVRPVLSALARSIQAFIRLEASSAIVLFAAAALAMVCANTALAVHYHALFAAEIFGVTIHHVINDGLMTLFFFVVGMEIKRELAVGTLASFRKALLPAIAALGGMVAPALIYYAFNRGGPGARGWGIPMATDIAFSLGCLTLLKKRVPHAVIIFLTALAIFDDIGGILVIALFYGAGLQPVPLLLSLAITVELFVLARLRVSSGLIYLVSGAALWLVLHHAGIHPTIAGVVLGLAIPTRLVDRYVHGLHPWVAFGVMPMFALANSGVQLGDIVFGSVSIGIIAGLLLGKTAGIFSTTWLALKLRAAAMPEGGTRAKIFGVSAVAGIGFTVALFIATLAFEHEPALLDQAKLGILVGSLAAGLIGCCILRLTSVSR